MVLDCVLYMSYSLFNPCPDGQVVPSNRHNRVRFFPSKEVVLRRSRMADQKTERHQILEGPSKMELMLALFDNKNDRYFLDS